MNLTMEVAIRASGVWLWLVLGASAWAATGADSEWVYPGPDGKLVYETTPTGDKMMDFSHAGYMGGGVALPEGPVRMTVKPVEGDCTAAIQEAIDEVSAMKPEKGFRGAVLLAPGEYTCSRTISLAADGVVLRGCHDDWRFPPAHFRSVPGITQVPYLFSLRHR